VESNAEAVGPDLGEAAHGGAEPAAEIGQAGTSEASAAGAWHPMEAPEASLFQADIRL
jgi:hypothetical protein